jgi:Putative ABC exporter
MSPMFDAARFLMIRSARNRARRVLSRLRQPRYALALLLGISYLGLLILGQRQGDAAPIPVPALQIGGTLLLTALAAKWWLFGADRLALAFSPAEIHFLFPAPVTRAGLLGYKLLRAQVLILVNVLIWIVLLHRGRHSPLPVVLYGATLWVMFSTLFLHRLGVALTRDALLAHGRAGLARHWPAVVGLLLAAVTVGLSVHTALDGLDVADLPDGLFGAVRLVAETAPLSWVLFPFRVPFLPLGAASPAQWLPLFLGALALAALHAVWVLRADRAFEETAIEASARRAERLERWRRQGAGTRPAVRRAVTWFRLAPDGHPLRAIIWKNLTRLARTASPGVAIAAGVMVAAIVGFTLMDGADHAEVTTFIATLSLSWLGVLAIFGPQWVRIDLRGELDHLPLLRTWPVSGPVLVTGQVVSSALVLTGLQLLLAVVGLSALTQTGEEDLAPATLLGLAPAALLALSTLNLVALGIQNAGALLYPSWVRSEIRPGGIEAMGQHVLTAGISLLLLLLALLGPGLAGGGLGYLLWDRFEVWSLLPALVVTAAGLALEAFLLLDWLGTRFERLDPSNLD